VRKGNVSLPYRPGDIFHRQLDSVGSELPIVLDCTYQRHRYHFGVVLGLLPACHIDNTFVGIGTARRQRLQILARAQQTGMFGRHGTSLASGSRLNAATGKNHAYDNRKCPKPTVSNLTDWHLKSLP